MFDNGGRTEVRSLDLRGLVVVRGGPGSLEAAAILRLAVEGFLLLLLLLLSLFFSIFLGALFTLGVLMHLLRERHGLLLRVGVGPGGLAVVVVDGQPAALTVAAHASI